MPLLGAFSCRPSVSPEPSVARMAILILLWLSPTGYCCRETKLIIRSRVYEQSCMVYLGICAASWLVYDVLFLCLFIFFMRLVRGIFHAYSYDAYILVVRCVRQIKDAVWYLVLLVVTGVRAVPK